MTPEQELLDTIEEIRQKSFPELPAELVRQIVAIERDFTENRPVAYRRIEKCVGEYLEKASPAKKVGV